MSVMLIVCLLGLVIFCWRDSRKPDRFPPGPNWFPLIGALPIIKKLHSICGFYHLVWHYLFTKYGSIVGLRAGRDRLIIVAGCEEIRQFYALDEFNGRPDGFFYRIRSFDQRLGVVFTDGRSWEQQRKFSLKTLRQLGMGRSSMVAHVEREAAEIVNYFSGLCEGGRKAVQMEHAFDVSVLNVMWALLAGHRFDLHDARLAQMIKLIHDSFRVIDMTGGVLNQFPLIRYFAPDMCGYRPLMQTLQPLWQFLMEVITEIKQTIVEKEPRSLIEAYLLEIKKFTNCGLPSSFSESQLLAICLDLFQAGTETTSNTLAFGIAYMLHNRDVQHKVRAELDRIIGPDRLPRLSDRAQLSYVEAVICEIQRLANVAPVGIVHRCTADVQLGKFHIPKDTMALVSLYSLHMDKDYWGDPYVFRPERFLNGDGQLIQHEHFLPFGLGKRRCMGEHLAKSSLFLYFATFMHAFNVEVSSQSGLPDTVGLDGITLSPKPFQAVLTPRLLRI